MVLQELAPCAVDININAQIMTMYLEHVLPAITQPGSDNNFGSAAMHDVLCLQVRLAFHHHTCISGLHNLCPGPILGVPIHGRIDSACWGPKRQRLISI